MTPLTCDPRLAGRLALANSVSRPRTRGTVTMDVTVFVGSILAGLVVGMLGGMYLVWSWPTAVVL